MFFPSSEGVEVAAWDLGGSGAALLFAHATGFHGHVWQPLAAHLDGLHCYSFDERGHGDSTMPPGFEFQPSFEAERIARLLAHSQ